jgi:hypothetical protein
VNRAQPQVQRPPQTAPQPRVLSEQRQQQRKHEAQPRPQMQPKPAEVRQPAQPRPQVQAQPKPVRPAASQPQGAPRKEQRQPDNSPGAKPKGKKDRGPE